MNRYRQQQLLPQPQPLPQPLLLPPQQQHSRMIIRMIHRQLPPPKPQPQPLLHPIIEVPPGLMIETWSWRRSSPLSGPVSFHTMPRPRCSALPGKKTAGRPVIPGRPAAKRGCCLLQLKGAGVQLIVDAVLGDQILVVAPLHDASMVQHHDGIGIAHSG